ncbi:transposase [Cryobacterium sp. Sr3]|uniref:transposase n=1 Tax=Cryobacterium sp. Sr3 TaxID=1259194 RepID=UPI00141BAA78|nr:transposase [Cryobacterium sp. Sr3]
MGNTRREFTSELKDEAVKLVINTGRPVSTVARELGVAWPSKNKASKEVGAWIEDRYNRRRRHTSLGQVSPVDFELQYSNQNAVFAKAA